MEDRTKQKYCSDYYSLWKKDYRGWKIFIRRINSFQFGKEKRWTIQFQKNIL